MSRKHVDRQATFDTDARKKGNLKLPVIDSKDDLISDTNSKKNAVNNKPTINAKGKPKLVEQSITVGSTNSNATKNGHIGGISQTANKANKGGSNSVQTTVSKQTKSESNVTSDHKSNKDKSTKSTNAHQNSTNTVPTAANNNAGKSTTLSKSPESKLAKKDAVDTGKTVPNNQKGKDTGKTDSSKQAIPKGAEKEDKISKSSVLSKVNRNRSISPTKRDTSPEKRVVEDNNKTRNDKTVNRNNFKPAKVPQPAASVNQNSTDKKTDKTKPNNDNTRQNVKADDNKSRGSISPRRVPNTSRTSSDKSEVNSLLDSNGPSESHLKRNTRGPTSRKESLSSSLSEQQGNSPNTSLDVPKSKNIKTPSPKYPQSPRDYPSPDKTVQNERSVNRVSDVNNGTDVTSTLTENQKQACVLTPGSTRVDYQASRQRRASRLGRLSPTNETIEQIKIESRQSYEKPKMDGRESYEQLQAERITLIHAEHAYKKRIKQLEDEANGFLKAIEELTSENRYLCDRLDDNDYMRVQGIGEHHSEKIAALEKENIKLFTRIKELERDLKNVAGDDELRELKAQVVKLQTGNQKVNDENKQLRSSNEENVRRLKALESDKKSLQGSVTTINVEKLDEINELHREHKELAKQLKYSHAKTKELEKKVDALDYENKELSQTLADKKSELSEILGVMKDENKFENEIKDLKNQILKLNKEKKDIEMAKNREKRVISDKLEETKISLEKVTSELDELKIKHDQSEKEKRRYKSELGPLKKKCEELDTQVTNLKDEIERLKKLLKESNEKYMKLLNETDNAKNDLKGTKDHLEKFNKELQGIVADKESQISKLINQLDSMREERDVDRKTLKVEKDKVTSEREKLEQYQNINRKLEDDLKHFVEKLDESRLKEKKLAVQLEDKTFQLSNLEQQVFEMNMKLDNHSKRMTEIDREKREMEREKREWDVKKDKIDDIEASNKRLLEENKRLRNQLEMNSYTRPTDRIHGDKDIVEAWVTDKSSPQAAIYVTKEKDRKRVHIVQPELQKKRQPFSKSGPAKQPKSSKKGVENKTKSPSRSLEDIRKAADVRTPESEYSLQELNRDAKLTVGYGAFAGYREIHKDRIRAANKKVY